MIKEIGINSRARVEMINLTGKIEEMVAEAGFEQGAVIIYTPHTTAALTINESADPDVQKDLINKINKVIPFDDQYRHFEGNSAAHIKSSLIGASEHVIINQGKPLLGRWQAIYFCEFDGPRKRKVYVKMLQG